MKSGVFPAGVVVAAAVCLSVMLSPRSFAANDTEYKYSKPQTGYFTIDPSAMIPDQGVLVVGANVFKKCLVCHAIGPGAINKVGPHLNGLNGRKAGTVASFFYSDALKNSGIVWKEANFTDFIANPAAKVPGTKMIFTGIQDRAEIAALWRYVKQFKANGQTIKKMQER